ncbi:MAG: tetratricopeptide repeat protein [Bryobacteraceae bacterium]|nr:tetratricopeptide repeat protein [Bryobacteraceae bacterium]
MGIVVLALWLALAVAPQPPPRTAPRPAQAARIEQLMKDGEAARQAELLEEAIRIYSEVVRLAPRKAEAWWYLGLAHYDRDNYAEAERAFARLVILDPQHGAALAMLGLAEYQNGKYDLALKHLLAAKTAREPLPAGTEMDTVARFHLIALLNRAGRHDLANVLLQEFAREKPETPLLIQAAGINLLRLPHLPGKVPPADREAVELAGRAVLLAWKGRHEDARREAEALAARFPGRPNVHYTLGYVHLLAADDEAMSAEMQKELEVTPGHVQARLQLANYWLKQGEAARGLPYAQQAVELAPEDFVAHQILGRLLLDLGRLKESIAELEQAVRLAPECLQCHTVLANAYARAGRAADAERQLRIRADIEKQSEALRTGAGVSK